MILCIFCSEEYFIRQIFIYTLDVTEVPPTKTHIHDKHVTCVRSSAEAARRSEAMSNHSQQQR